MNDAIRIDATLCRHQGLCDDEAAKDPLPAILWAAAAKQVFLKLFQIETLDQLLHRFGLSSWLRHNALLRL